MLRSGAEENEISDFEDLGDDPEEVGGVSSVFDASRRYREGVTLV